MSQRSGYFIAMLGAVALASANNTSLQAAPTTYGDFGSWSSAVGAFTTVTIPEPNGGGGFDFFGAGDASVTYEGVVFSTSSNLSDGNFFNVGSGFSGQAPVLSSQQQNSGVANILITFPFAVQGFALNFGTFDSANLSFSLSNDGSFVLSSPGSGGYTYTAAFFVGATDSSSFTSVRLTIPSDALDIKNISYAAAPSGVPDAGSGAALLGLGFAGLAALRRKLGQ